MKLGNIGRGALLAAAALSTSGMLGGSAIPLANELQQIDREDGFIEGPLNRHGAITLANDASRFVGATYQQALTQYSVGWEDSDELIQLVNFIAPPVPVARRFDYKTFNNVEQFLSDTGEDLRQIGGDFKEVERFQNEVEGKTENRGLACRIDKDQMTPGWEERELASLLRRLQRNQARRAMTLLSATAVNTAKTWDTTAGKNPDRDVKTELITAADLVGIRPNRILYGDTSWDRRGIAYDAQDNAGGYAGADAEIGQMSSRLMVQKAMVSSARYSSSATARAQIVNDKVLMFTAFDGASANDPSNIKLFYTLCDNGQRFAVYKQDFPKYVILMVEHYELLKATSTLAVRQFTVS